MQANLRRRLKLNINNIALPIKLATKEINRICLELENAANGLHNLSEIEFTPDINVRDETINDTTLLESAKTLIRQRIHRRKHFDESKFAEPFWDILLDLFISKLMGLKISVSSACLASGVPPTTALRYVSHMCKVGDVIRTDDPNDGRRIYLEISESAFTAMKKYLREEVVSVQQSRAV